MAPLSKIIFKTKSGSPEILLIKFILTPQLKTFRPKDKRFSVDEEVEEISNRESNFSLTLGIPWSVTILVHIFLEVVFGVFLNKFLKPSFRNFNLFFTKLINLDKLPVLASGWIWSSESSMIAITSPGSSCKSKH